MSTDTKPQIPTFELALRRMTVQPPCHITDCLPVAIMLTLANTQASYKTSIPPSYLHYYAFVTIARIQNIAPLITL
jgi:hypothetical protein